MKFVWQTLAVCVAAVFVLQQAALALPKVVPSLAVLVLLIVLLRIAWKWTGRHH